MSRTITDRDMRDQVHEVLGDEDACFNITEIVDDIQAKFGTIDVAKVPSNDFWEIVNRHYIDSYI